ncbi:hypothetical protein F5B19DRAFT_61354 [Rostrohypoxylon terebratum]|nr:hypothetical protein F5B19DRAFT_61354 [Rostrohypoxylon terebratum]
MQFEPEYESRAYFIFIAQAFLWSSWQRLSMMMLWQSLRSHLVGGFETNEFRSIRGTAISSDVFIRSGGGDISKLPSYMCPWAFRSLCVEQSAATLDFRRFHQRFRDAFGSRPARCLSPEDFQCDGKAATNCIRFKGAIIVDQQAHDGHFLGLQYFCKRLYWNEPSYQSVKKMRAVCIHSSKSDLRYREAKARILAISHVWSHGQGGRPDNGMNQCLHKRYSKLAKEMGCDSYWMDTSCIPDDHKLRAKAIKDINPIFESSFVTLVCDKDLMELDISGFTRLKRRHGQMEAYDPSIIACWKLYS